MNTTVEYVWRFHCILTRQFNIVGYRGLPCAMSTIRPGFLYEWMYIMSPMDPSVSAGQNTGMLFWEERWKRGGVTQSDGGRVREKKED